MIRFEYIFLAAKEAPNKQLDINYKNLTLNIGSNLNIFLKFSFLVHMDYGVVVAGSDERQLWTRKLIYSQPCPKLWGKNIYHNYTKEKTKTTFLLVNYRENGREIKCNIHLIPWKLVIKVVGKKIFRNNIISRQEYIFKSLYSKNDPTYWKVFCKYIIVF